MKLEEPLEAAGAPCELVSPDAADVQHPTVLDDLLDVLPHPD